EIKAFRTWVRWIATSALAWFAVPHGCFPVRADDPPTMTEDEALEFFTTRIEPILKRKCWECHGDDPESLAGGLALTSRADILHGGDSGPAVDERHVDASILLRAVNYDLYEMPPDGKLSKRAIEDLTTWVKLGMPWPEKAERRIHGDAGAGHAGVDWEAARQWWSFQPVPAVVPPEVQHRAWPVNEIDQFILAALEIHEMKPAPEASRETLIRRAYYDLIGLPPLPEQVRQFADDPDPLAYEKLIDQLLESPHYGEKWGRHWLDLVRYAESNSFERDGTKPFVWRYRDYVIRSLNEDKPYDQFLLEQLAGDELPEVTAETLIATGFYRLGQWDDEPADMLQARFDELDDILATTSQVTLGLTVNCARCHDHKIDPISQHDYYALMAFFSNVRRYGIRDEASVRDASLRSLNGEAAPAGNVRQRRRALREIESALAEIENLVKPDFSPVEHEEFQYEFHRIHLVAKRSGGLISQQQADEYARLTEERGRLLVETHLADQTILCVKESGADPEPMFVRIRGNPHVLGPEVQPRFLTILGGEQPELVPSPNGESTGRRLALANWIVNPDHPLTARVMVNRVWQHHFGRGLVRSANDFGLHGNRPTHPELLDWLATRFVEEGWKLKSLHRLMMLSRTYRMSSQWNDDYGVRDANNDLFWRFNLRRLSAEELRDSILFANGTLNLSKQFGPSVFVTLPQEVLQGQSRPGDGWGRSSEEDESRRSIYIHVKRSLRVPLLEAFDSADTDTSCPVRFVTTLPTQALSLLNSEFSQQQAQRFAELAFQREPSNRLQRMAWLLARVTQRQPTAEEVNRGIALIDQWIEQDGLAEPIAWQHMCLLALNMNEFVFVD
ncbi:MAG TPA: PSD1 and planctomycete cytochrome C domain-containing protein, partial [Pirellulaceae bacterium]|nr:PSD1 and planctomycete cytochrome C domain-containing protein [Pirellulaceae bacterium]